MQGKSSVLESERGGKGSTELTVNLRVSLKSQSYACFDASRVSHTLARKQQQKQRDAKVRLWHTYNHNRDTHQGALALSRRR